MKMKLSLWFVFVFIIGIFSTTYSANDEMTFILNFSEQDLKFTKKVATIDKQLVEYDLIEIKGKNRSMAGEPGEPWLPGYYMRYLLPPETIVFDVKVKTLEEMVLDGTFDIYPTQPSKPLSKPGPHKFIKQKESVYSLKTPIPGSPAEYISTGVMRDYYLAAVRMNPVAYIPSTGKIILRKQIEITIKTKPVSGKNRNNKKKKSHPYFESLVQSIVENPKEVLSYQKAIEEEVLSLEKNKSMALMNEPYPPGPSDKDDAKYLLIIPYNIYGWPEAYEDLLDWKIKKGIPYKVVWIYGDGGIENMYDGYGYDLQEKIKACIRDHYTNHGTVWVCIGADANHRSLPAPIIPVRECFMEIGDDSSNIATDYYYACLDNQPGTGENNWKWDDNENGIYGEEEDNPDIYPDIFIGRIPAKYSSHASYVVAKTLSYENNPPTDGFLERMIFMGDSEGNEIVYDDYMDPLWNITCQKFYKGGYSDPPLGSGYTLTPYNINEQLSHIDGIPQKENGYNFVHSFGHGNLGLWMFIDGYFHLDDDWDNKYYNKHVNYGLDGTSVDNIDHYMNIVCCRCYSNCFNKIIEPYIYCSDQSMGEAFMLYQKGAVSYIGSTTYGWSFYSPNFSGSYYQSLFDGEIYDKFNTLYINRYHQHVGADLAYAKIVRACEADTNEYYRWLLFSVNLLGDPELCLYTKNPSQLDFSYNLVEAEISVIEADYPHDPVPNALVCITSQDSELTDYWNGYTDENGILKFNQIYFTQPNPYDIVITAPNYSPYQGTIDIPNNDECIGARTLYHNDCVNMASDLDDATLSPYPDFPECIGTHIPIKDVWYRIHPGKNQKVEVTISTDSNYNGFVVYYGFCGSFYPVGCNEAFMEFDRLIFITDPNNDYDYYIRLYNTDTFHISGELCVIFTDVSPILHYPMNEGEGTTLINYGIAGSDGTIPDDQSWIEGAQGKALDFDGINDQIQNANTNGFNPAVGSVVFWMKDVIDTNPGSAAFNIGSPPLIRLKIVQNAAIITGNSYGSEINIPFNFNDGKWHQVAVTWYSPSYRRLYIDGILQGSGSFNSTGFSVPGYYWVGYIDEGEPYFWEGKMDELRVYDYSIEDLEIQALIPINDECSSAKELENAVEVNIDPSINMGTPSDDPPDCAGLSSSDVWYHIHPGIKHYVAISLNTSIEDAGFALYSGSCGSLELMECGEVSNGTKAYEFLSDPLVETDYYIRVFRDSQRVLVGTIEASWIYLPDPIIHFPMNETSSSVINYGTAGSCGYGFYYQGVTRVAGPTGSGDYALNFNGLNGRLLSVGTCNFDQYKGSVAMWVKDVKDNSSNFPQSVAFAVAKDWNTEVIRLRVEEDRVAYYNDACGYLTAYTNLNDNKWHQVVATWNYDENRRRIYIDGELIVEGTYPHQSYTLPTDYRIGDFHSTYYFLGTMDELRVYNRELYPLEVMSLLVPTDLGSPPSNDVCNNEGIPISIEEAMNGGFIRTGALTAYATPFENSLCNPGVPDIWYYLQTPSDFPKYKVDVYFKDNGYTTHKGLASIYTGDCSIPIILEACDTTRSNWQFHTQLTAEPNSFFKICVGSELESLNQEVKITCSICATGEACDCAFPVSCGDTFPDPIYIPGICSDQIPGFPFTNPTSRWMEIEVQPNYEMTIYAADNDLGQYIGLAFYDQCDDLNNTIDCAWNIQSTQLSYTNTDTESKILKILVNTFYASNHPDMSIDCAPLGPLNDECSGAIPLTQPELFVDISSDISIATFSQGFGELPGCATPPANPVDIWYTVPGDVFAIVFDLPSANTGFVVYEDCDYQSIIDCSFDEGGFHIIYLDNYGPFPDPVKVRVYGSTSSTGIIAYFY